MNLLGVRLPLIMPGSVVALRSFLRQDRLTQRYSAWALRQAQRDSAWERAWHRGSAPRFAVAATQRRSRQAQRDIGGEW